MIDGVKDYMILTDLMGIEDSFGDMDFKIAGTKNGLTAVQLDMKLVGIPVNVLCEGLDAAKSAHLRLIDAMNNCLPESRSSLKAHAPIVKSVRIDIKDTPKLIGAGGHIIQAIQRVTGAELDIEGETSCVVITAPTQESLKKCSEMIKDAIGSFSRPGDIVEAKITSVQPFGVMIELTSDATEHLIPTVQWTDDESERSNMSTKFAEGDIVEVMCVQSIPGRPIVYSRKAAIWQQSNNPAERAKLQLLLNSMSSRGGGQSSGMGMGMSANFGSSNSIGNGNSNGYGGGSGSSSNFGGTVFGHSSRYTNGNNISDNNNINNINNRGNIMNVKVGQQQSSNTGTQSTDDVGFLDKSMDDLDNLLDSFSGSSGDLDSRSINDDSDNIEQDTEAGVNEREALNAKIRPNYDTNTFMEFINELREGTKTAKDYVGKSRFATRVMNTLYHDIDQQTPIDSKIYPTTLGSATKGNNNNNQHNNNNKESKSSKRKRKRQAKKERQAIQAAQAELIKTGGELTENTKNPLSITSSLNRMVERHQEKIGDSASAGSEESNGFAEILASLESNSEGMSVSSATDTGGAAVSDAIIETDTVDEGNQENEKQEEENKWGWEDLK